MTKSRLSDCIIRRQRYIGFAYFSCFKLIGTNNHNTCQRCWKLWSNSGSNWDILHNLSEIQVQIGFTGSGK